MTLAELNGHQHARAIDAVPTKLAAALRRERVRHAASNGDAPRRVDTAALLREFGDAHPISARAAYDNLKPTASYSGFAAACRNLARHGYLKTRRGGTFTRTRKPYPKGQPAPAAEP